MYVYYIPQINNLTGDKNILISQLIVAENVVSLVISYRSFYLVKMRKYSMQLKIFECSGMNQVAQPLKNKCVFAIFVSIFFHKKVKLLF